MKHLILFFLFYLPFSLFSQTTKVKNNDIITLQEQIKELKIENSLLIEKISQLNLKFSQIEKTLLNNQIETINYIDRVQKSILFLKIKFFLIFPHLFQCVYQRDVLNRTK